jgi:hypothetical protein
MLTPEIAVDAEIDFADHSKLIRIHKTIWASTDPKNMTQVLHQNIKGWLWKTYGTERMNT